MLSEIEITRKIMSANDNILGLKGLYIPKKKILNKFSLSSTVYEKCVLVSDRMKCSLEDHLKSRRNTFTILKFIDFSMQIATGMHHLEQNEIIHRDLATRNVLIDDFEKTLKICDFGLSKKPPPTKIYQNHLTIKAKTKIWRMKGRGDSPWPWDAIESLDFEKKQYSSKSDVWQMGVTMWEIFVRAILTPYMSPGQSVAARDNIETFNHLRQGYRLDRPTAMPKEIYDLCLSCWNPEAEARPKFMQIRDTLADIKNMLPASSLKINIDMSQCNLEPSTYMINDTYSWVTPNKVQDWYSKNRAVLSPKYKITKSSSDGSFTTEYFETGFQSDGVPIILVVVPKVTEVAPPFFGNKNAAFESLVEMNPRINDDHSNESLDHVIVYNG